MTDEPTAEAQERLAAGRHLAELINGYQVSAAIGAFARLGVADALSREAIEWWLRETDEARLERLWAAADEARRRYVGDAVHLRGLIEVSNYCVRGCTYCGIRAGNRGVARYRVSEDVVLDCARKAVEFGYGTLVIQAGEDSGITQEWMTAVLRRILDATLAAGLSQSVVVDSLASRVYPGPTTAVRRELFFGTETKEQIDKTARQARADRFRNWWIVTISLLVTVFGVANALLMSVTERFREIGTMKCLGALSSFIRRLFLIESSLIGLAGSIVGVILGALLPLVAYGFVYEFGLVFSTLPYGRLGLSALATVLVGTLLAVLAAIYPARFASRMVPASALRSTV